MTWTGVLTGLHQNVCKKYMRSCVATNVCMYEDTCTHATGRFADISICQEATKRYEGSVLSSQ